MQNDEYINYYNEKNYVEIFTDDNYIEVSNTGGLTGKTGERGADGRDGQDGQNATIRVGQTTTAEPGTPAQVENTGTDTNAILKFTIPKGSKGDRGEKGYQGDAATVSVGSTTTGAPGTSAVVTNTGDEHQAVLNFTIPRGAQGAQGQDGESSTITVGTTTTGNPGTNASVTNTGTESAAVLNFTIPRGNPGEKGDDGDSATIEVGTTTTGEPGTNASVVNTGTQSAAVLNFTIPRGNKGDSGDPGEDGQAATIAVGTVTTGEPGTPATVTNVGTSSAAIFNFSIPKGAKGESGEGTGDMLASTYDPNQTVANNGGIVQYIDNQNFVDTSYHDATKQDKLSSTQLDAVNSGVTSAKVSTYDGYATSKQNKLTAGTGISIVGDTISNTQTSAEWGAITGTLSSQTDLQTALNAKANTSSLAAVATTGAYSDLSGKPTIPTVNNATLTIQKNGTTVQTFTANSSTNKTANITVPTKTSDLENDMDFLQTLAAYILFVPQEGYVATDNNYTTTDKNKLAGIAAGAEVNVQSDWNVTSTTSDAFIKNKPTIPTATSDLTNDSGFITATDSGTVTSVSSVIDLVYPVGTKYYTADASFNPNSTWGGTWSSISGGWQRSA